MKKSLLAAAWVLASLLAASMPGALPAAAQSIDIDGIAPLPLPPGGGGQYLGPQDIVPSGNSLPPFDPYLECAHPPEGFCNGSALPQDCGAECDALRFERWGSSSCVGCSGGGGGCYLAKGYNLTFGALRGYCSGEVVCPEPNGVVTVCLDVPNVCEVHVLTSSWLSHGVFPNKPICMPVPAQVCVNGTGIFRPPVSFSTTTHGGLGCQPARVCLSFQRNCLCSAVNAWEHALRLQPFEQSTWDKKWLFHVGFTTCQACDGCR